MAKGKRLIRVMITVIMIFSLVVPGILYAGEKGDFRPASYYGQPEEHNFFPNQVILKLKGNVEKQKDFITKNNLQVLRNDFRLNYILAKTPDNTDIAELIKELRGNPLVQYAQPNFIYKPFEVSNDPLYSRQWNLPKIKAQAGWNIAAGKEDVIIAILDTGVDVNHPDLKDKLIPGTNALNPLKSARDTDGHGTHVAGIAAAVSNNGIGIAGVANKSKIMPVKVFDYWGGSDITVADGIVWAADHGAKVINMSFGGLYNSALLSEAIEYANSKGVVMVAAAGNWASNYISYPAALSEVIAVSATNKGNKLARFSSFGPEIDVSAPGENIFSSYWDSYKGSTYCELSGTSMAAPQVAGLAALLLSQNPNLTSEEVRQIIESSAVDLGEPGWDSKYGHGLIDVKAALTTSFSKINSENNSFDKALPIKSGVQVAEKLDYGSDEDWYAIEVTEQASLAIELQPAGNVTPALEIYNSDGELVESFNVLDADIEPELWWFFSEETPGIKVGEAIYGMIGNLSEGRYGIRVFGNHNRWSDTTYQLKAEIIAVHDMVTDKGEDNNNRDDASKLKIGTNISGKISPSGDEDWYKVYMRRGKTYKVGVDVPEGLDLSVQIYRETPKDIEAEEQWFYYEFPEQIIDFGGQGEDETGTFKASDDKVSAYYYLKISDTAKGAVREEYKLNVEEYYQPRDRWEPNDSFEDAKSVDIASQVKAYFSEEYDSDYYKFTVTKTGILKIDFNGSKSLEATVYLYDDDESMIGFRDIYLDSGIDNLLGGDLGPIEFKVEPGEYYIEMCNGVYPGEYSFQLNEQYCNFIDPENNDSYDKAVPASLGNVKKGTIYPFEDEDYYVVDVMEKGPVLVYITPPKGIDSMVSVFKEPDLDSDEGQGEEGAEQEDGIPSEWLQDKYMLDYITDIDTGKFGETDTGVFVANKPGRFYLCVAGWVETPGQVTKEPYTLTLNKFTIKADYWENNNTIETSAPIGNNAVFSPTFMGTEDKDWYKIWIPSSSILNIELDVPNDIDGVLEFYDPSGDLLTRVDQALIGEKESISYKIKKGGIYYIKTYDYMGNASVLPYTLNAKYKR